MAEPAAAPSTPAAQAAAARLAAMRQPQRAAPPAPGAATPVSSTTAVAGKPAGQAAKASRKEKKAAKAVAVEGGATEKKKPPVKVIAIVLLVVVVGYVAKGKLMKPHYGPSDPAPAGQVLGLGSVTTNLSDGHLAQVSISLQLTKPASMKKITADGPQLTATVVTDLGEQTYAGLLAPAGRAALRAALLESFQQEVGTAEGGEQISAVYFTGFVLQ